MGRQIRFFATPHDINILLKKIYSDNIIVIGDFGQEIKQEQFFILVNSDFSGNSFGMSQAYIAKKEFDLFYNSYDNIEKINQISSEAIEFHTCPPSPAKTIDTSPVDNNFKKGGFIVVDDSDEFDRQMKELMKNPTYIDNPSYVENGFEHGRFWYAPEYYDDYGNKVRKSKELDILFNNLSKFIKKNYRLTKDKFAYIGPDAYEKYLEGSFVPCCGRNKIVVE